ncbi:MAG: ADP-ribosylglycohydrolase [Erysipelothrix sp.]|nr:ADP-ribosylglycohydrolase [Erysipelothrix sp.]
MTNTILDAVMGLAVADAVGVPVEFKSREALILNPVKDMQAYGTYNQPKGTWSDDTSMTLCLVDSLIKGLDYHDIMTKFLKWFSQAAYSAHEEVFDIGNTTRESLNRFTNGIIPLECGGMSEFDNGNGSLMRILPILFYLQTIYGDEFEKNDVAFEIIHNISSLTHRHLRSHIACGIYVCVASKLLKVENIEKAIKAGIDVAMQYYQNNDKYAVEVKHFMRLTDSRFKELNVSKIKSGGYVVDTLEAALWSLFNSNDYKTCVLKAVNLGGDTDTVAAVAGGLAGLKYGYNSIPSEWKTAIAKRDYIENLSNDLYKRLNK